MKNNFEDEEIRVPSIPIRVRWHPTDVDETFDGTVIQESDYYYVVIPDDDLMMTVKWNKNTCEII